VDLTERPEIFFTAGILPRTSRLKPSGPIDRHATDSKVRKPQWILLNSHTVVKRFCEILGAAGAAQNIKGRDFLGEKLGGKSLFGG
jgi:hypothetical protein